MKCKNCKHWDIADEDGRYGICESIELNVDTFAHPPLDGAFVESDVPKSVGAILVTGPGFYCKNFKSNDQTNRKPCSDHRRNNIPNKR